jgi:hypothetical protein
LGARLCAWVAATGFGGGGGCGWRGRLMRRLRSACCGGDGPEQRCAMWLRLALCCRWWCLRLGLLDRPEPGLVGQGMAGLGGAVAVVVPAGGGWGWTPLALTAQGCRGLEWLGPGRAACERQLRW